MDSVAIVTDSVACLTREMVEKYGITVVPLKFYCEDRAYRDGVDITPAEAYQIFLKDPSSFRTSPPTPGEFLEVFRSVSKRARNILCICLSSYISATHDVAREAGEELKSQEPGVVVEVLDSRQAAVAEGFVALAAVRAAAEGKPISEVVSAAREMREKVSFFIFLDTIRYVYRSGRLPKVASQLGSMLSVKPVLTMSSGELHFAGAVRNRNSGVERLLRTMREKVGQRPVHVAVTHAYSPDDAERLKQQIASEFDCTELWISEFSPLMGYACGTGTLGIAFYPD